MFRTAALTAMLLLSTSAFAAQNWVVDPDKSKLSFTGQQGDEKFTGGFKTFIADIRFSPDDLPNSAITVTVDTGSAFAGSAERDDALPGKNWFDIARFPQAVFASKSIKATGSNAYIAEGTLTIRGVSKDVALPFTLTEQDDKTHAVGEVTLQRNDYGIGQGEFAGDGWVKFPVTVTIDIWASKQP